MGAKGSLLERMPAKPRMIVAFALTLTMLAGAVFGEIDWSISWLVPLFWMLGALSVVLLLTVPMSFARVRLSISWPVWLYWSAGIATVAYRAAARDLASAASASIMTALGIGALFDALNALWEIRTDRVEISTQPQP